MGECANSKKEMKFQSLDALKTVASVLNEVDEAIEDKTRTIRTSAIPEALVGAVGVSVGAGTGFAALYLGGSVVGLSAAGITSGLAAAGALIGGGMVAGIAVLAAPAVILGTIGVGVTATFKNKKLRETKMICYNEALRKQTAIIEALAKEKDADEERMDYLNSLNTLLQAAIRDLKFDLGIE
ncbi:MAG: hypothetical protein RSC15_07305 [Lactococcus sp.]